MTTLTLPDDLLAWVEQVVGAPVQRAHRIPGGGVREGWFLDVGPSPEQSAELFLRCSTSTIPDSAAFHLLSTEAAVVRALHAAGITVAQVHAVHPTREAVLMERISGRTWFSQIRDPQEQLDVAQDFIRNLAAVHRLDPAALAVPALGPVLSAREIALARIADIRARARQADGSTDPLVALSADWLEQNVPDYDGPVVLVQGDTGPGNFMYQDGRVTAVVDWELCHWGDPMDDIAWLSLRTVQDTFTHLPDRLREYAKLSGHELDVERVWYYRVFAETTMATLNLEQAEAPAGGTAPAVRDGGNALIYEQLHRRLWLETLGVVMHLDLADVAVPEPPSLPPWHPVYDDVLGMLRTIAPRIEDPLAAQWTKGVARLVRYLKEVDAVGRTSAEQEVAELTQVLGGPPAPLEEARAALDRAYRSGQVPPSEYVRHLWTRVQREDHLMRTASGALRERSWPPLV